MYILMFMFKLILVFILACVLIIISACMVIYMYVFILMNISIWRFVHYIIKFIITNLFCMHTRMYFYIYMAVDYHAYIYMRAYVFYLLSILQNVNVCC